MITINHTFGLAFVNPDGIAAIIASNESQTIQVRMIASTDHFTLYFDSRESFEQAQNVLVNSLGD